MRRSKYLQSRYERTSRLRPRFAVRSGLTTLGMAIGMMAAAPAQALEGSHNVLPGICQGLNGVAYSANELASYVTPVPFDLGFSAGAFAGNWGLRLCPPQILAPEDRYFEADSTAATSDGTDVPDPARNDPACYATVRQAITKEQYDNFLGASFNMRPWGTLGTPQVYHFNTSADVRILGVHRIDDPSTDGNETLADELPLLRDANGNTILKLPVGRNGLTYRADTLISPLDFLFIYLPKIPAGSKPFRTLATASEKISEAAVRAYRATRSAVNAIQTPVGQLALERTLVTDTYRHSQLRVIDDIYNQDLQRAWVYDRIPPVIRSSIDVDSLPPLIRAVVGYDVTNEAYVLEAIHPGGIKAQAGKDFLSALLSYNDRCGHRVDVHNDAAGGNFWPVGAAFDLTWTAQDPGPTDQDGGRNSAHVVQRIQVRDTQPPVLLAPPSRVIEVPAGQSNAQVSLGNPRVFDLANLEPAVTNNAASNTFGLGLNQVTWSASDGSNTSQAVQLINIKTQGTNRAPVAHAQTIETRSFEDTEIFLSGADADFHPSVDRYDPLSFNIATPPQHGFFVAPLLPFFIDDYRLEASALKFTGQLRQTNPSGYCSTYLGRHDDVNPSAWQMSYPYSPDWLAVDDDGNTIVYDRGDMRCDNNGSPTSFPRLAIFNAEQDIVATRDLPTGVFIEDLFWHPDNGYIYVTWSDNQGDDFVVVYDAGLVQRVRYNVTLWTGDQEPTTIPRVRSAIADHRGVLYVADSGDRGVKAYRQLESGDVLAANVYLGNAFAPGSIDLQSMAVDSQNNLYVGYNDRIYKVTAAQVDDNGAFTPGEVVGWAGRCSANLTNTYACDVENGVSLGYSCTDALCARTGGVYGSRPGQFNQAQGIAIDPNDILYVSDFANARVQRFTPDGFFAGQARSQGVGYGFLLGDFGQPADIEVNSNHFYVLNRDNDLLHIFETTPITPIDDATAKVVYRSNNNYLGPDQFRFSATDGLDSAEATVTIAITRNFRAPSIPNADRPVTIPPTLEDTPTTFILNGSDPDGDLDTLSVVVEQPPKHGNLTFNGLIVTYTPNSNYAGPDAFIYRVSDGREISAEAALIDLSVSEVEDVPTIEAASEGTVSLGFRFAHTVEVFDPDPEEALLVTIDWGDGTQVTDGHFELNGEPLDWREATNEDGTIRDDVTRTGPILGLDPTGRGVLADDHVYSTAGVYEITSCVHDKVELDETTQVKTLTGASKQSCATTQIAVSASAELSIEIAAPEDELALSAPLTFSATVRNRTFDIALALPGTDVFGLEVSGELPEGISLVAVRTQAGVCTTSAQTFACAIPQLLYEAEAAIEVDARVADNAAGGAELALFMEAEWPDMREKASGAQAVIIEQSAEPPVLTSVSPEFGDPRGFNEVTLSGMRFAHGARVRFGERYGTNARVLNSETIVVTVPAQAVGSVDVLVIHPDEREALLADAYRYGAAIEPPQPPETTPPAPPPSTGGGGGGSGGGGGGLGSLMLAAMMLFACARLRRGGILYRVALI